MRPVPPRSAAELRDFQWKREPSLLHAPFDPCSRSPDKPPAPSPCLQACPTEGILSQNAAQCGRPRA
eukprot:6801432-Pyramimonas_sp.AAC.1